MIYDRERERVLVHADGGDCHGMPLDSEGKCPRCGIYPDMQSTEFWPLEKTLVYGRRVK